LIEIRAKIASRNSGRFANARRENNCVRALSTQKEAAIQCRAFAMKTSKSLFDAAASPLAAAPALREYHRNTDLQTFAARILLKAVSALLEADAEGLHRVRNRFCIQIADAIILSRPIAGSSPVLVQIAAPFKIPVTSTLPPRDTK